MEISNIKVIERTIDILNPATKEKLGIQITLMSPKDPRLDKLRDAISQKQLTLQTKNKVQKVDDLKADRLKILFAAITGWDWGENKWDGETPELKPVVFNDIMERAPWMMEQIDEAFSEAESFFNNAETN